MQLPEKKLYMRQHAFDAIDRGISDSPFPMIAVDCEIDAVIKAREECIRAFQLFDRDEIVINGKVLAAPEYDPIHGIVYIGFDKVATPADQIAYELKEKEYQLAQKNDGGTIVDRMREVSKHFYESVNFDTMIEDMKKIDPATRYVEGNTNLGRFHKLMPVDRVYNSRGHKIWPQADSAPALQASPEV